jgi:aldehyde dehydrogenase (NAD+)
MRQGGASSVSSAPLGIFDKTSNGQRAKKMSDVGTRSEEMTRIFDLHGRHAQSVRKTRAAARIEKLRKPQAAIEGHFSEVLGALAEDLGKPPFEGAMDAGAPLADIEEFAAHLEDWMQPQQVALGSNAAPNATARILYQPRGQVLIFGPWNFPFSPVFQPLIGAIAAGNTVIIKPSEMAPATSAVTARIISEVFDPAEVTVFQGGQEIATQLLNHPFDHIFFTGSTNVGRRVLTAASRHLSTVTLELGGNCPVVIDNTSDVTMAGPRIAWGKYLNAGQVCLAPDHVWVKPEQSDAFAAQVASYIDRSYYKDGNLTRFDLARIVDERNLARLQRLLNETVAQGARILCGGNAHGLQLEPMVLVDVPRDSAIMREEIFGPILPVLTYTDTDDVIAEINRRDKPLALYIFSERQEFIDDVLIRTSSGGVTVNDVIQHAAESNLPFGGVGASGMGAYHGIHSFQEMSHARAIYSQAPVNPIECVIRPPYGDRMPG